MYHYHEIYPQTVSTFSMSFLPTNLFWSGSVGVYGANPILRFDGGKILDDAGKFIYALPPNQKVSISGNLRNEIYNIFIQGVPIFSKTGSYGKCSGVFFESSGIDLFSDAGLSYAMAGDTIPKYHISYDTTGDFMKTLQRVTVNISGDASNGHSIKIYSGEIGAANSSNFSFSGFDQGTGCTILPSETVAATILQTQLSTSQYSNLPIIWHTNFGEITDNISVSQPINNSRDASTYSFSAPRLFAFQIFDGDVIEYDIEISSNNTNIAPYYFSLFDVDNSSMVNGYQDSFSGSWWAFDGTSNRYPQNSGYLTGVISGGSTLSAFSFLKMVRPYGYSSYSTGVSRYVISGSDFCFSGLLNSSVDQFRQIIPSVTEL